MSAFTFSDVLIKPKYSEIESRKNVDLSVTLGYNTKVDLPIISANMKTITASKMAIELAKTGAIGILHRFNTIEEAVNEFTEVKSSHELPSAGVNNLCGVSIGVQEADKERFDKLYEAGAKVFCIDIAHGFSSLMKKTIGWIRTKGLNDITIIAGNIATPEAAITLTDWGADVLKAGIGGGCFIPNTKITTISGIKDIQTIEPGEYVLTHTGNYQRVITTFTYDKDNEELICINGDITCTKNHEIYVIHKNDLDKVTDENIDRYAKWMSAEDITEDYMLIEIQ